MASVTTLKIRRENREQALREAWDAYHALMRGQVQSYTIGSRSLTKFDLKDLMDMIAELEKEVDSLDAAIANGGKRRKAVGVIPRDF